MKEIIDEMRAIIARQEELSKQLLEAVDEATKPPNFRGIKEATHYLYNK
jgi:GTP cyclohydrolase I